MSDDLIERLETDAGYIGSKTFHKEKATAALLQEAAARIATLERELAEARRVVGGEELVEEVAKIIGVHPWCEDHGCMRQPGGSTASECPDYGCGVALDKARAVIAAIAPSIASAARERRALAESCRRRPDLAIDGRAQEASGGS